AAHHARSGVRRGQPATLRAASRSARRPEYAIDSVPRAEFALQPRVHSAGRSVAVGRAVHPRVELRRMEAPPTEVERPRQSRLVSARLSRPRLLRARFATSPPDWLASPQSWRTDARRAPHRPRSGDRAVPFSAFGEPAATAPQELPDLRGVEGSDLPLRL